MLSSQALGTQAGSVTPRGYTGSRNSTLILVNVLQVFYPLSYVPSPKRVFKLPELAGSERCRRNCVETEMKFQPSSCDFWTRYSHSLTKGKQDVTVFSYVNSLGRHHCGRLKISQLLLPRTKCVVVC